MSVERSSKRRRVCSTSSDEDDNVQKDTTSMPLGSMLQIDSTTGSKAAPREEVREVELGSFKDVDKVARVISSSNRNAELSASLVFAAFSLFAPWQDQVDGHPSRDFQANRRRFYKNGGLEAMIKLIKSNRPGSVREDVIAALWNYCCSTEDQQRVHDLGGTDIVIDILVAHDRHRQFRCDVKGSLGIIWHLCCLESVRRRLMERKALTSIVKLNQYLPDFCTGIFFHISRISDYHVDMVQYGCIEYLMAAEHTEESVDIKLRKMITMATLATHPKNMYRVKSTNFLPIINKFCAEHTPASLSCEEGFRQKEELQFLVPSTFIDLADSCFEEVQSLALLILAAGTMKKDTYLYRHCKSNDDVHRCILRLKCSTNSIVQTLAIASGQQLGLRLPNGRKPAQNFISCNMRDLMISGECSDMTIACADGSLPAHRCVLMARCPKMLSTQEAEGFKFVDVQATRMVLNFVYSGFLDLYAVHKEGVIDRVKQLADVLELDSLVEELEGFVERLESTKCEQLVMPKAHLKNDRGVCGQSLNGFNEMVLAKDVMLSVAHKGVMEVSFDLPAFVEPSLVAEAYFEAGIVNMSSLQAWSNGITLPKDESGAHEPYTYRFPIIDPCKRRHSLTIQNLGKGHVSIPGRNPSLENGAAVVLFVNLHFRNWHGVGSVSFLDDMKAMFRSSDTFDLTIRCADGETVQCHRAVLVARVEYFRVMLVTSGMKESRSSEIDLSHVSADVVRLIVRWAYVNQVSSRSVPRIMELMHVAEIMGADGLVQDCKDMLRRGLDHNNVISTWASAQLHNMESVKLLAAHLIAQASLFPHMVQRIIEVCEECPDLVPHIIQLHAVRASALSGALAKNDKFTAILKKANITIE